MTRDDFRFKGQRLQLVRSLQQKGIVDKKVLEALLEVPRHAFFDAALIDYAYVDKAYPIAAGQTISQPYTVAFQSQLLEIEKGDKVLEIGTGSGYQAAILAKMGARVYSIERQRDLFKKSEMMFLQLGYNVKTFYGDGYLGKPTYGPFKKIIVTCGAPFLPEALKQQVEIGGFIVIPVDNGKSQIMKRFIRISEEEYKEEDHGLFSFVPMIDGIE